MSITPTSALACPFVWSPASPDVTVTISGVPHTAQLPAGTWRILLGKGTTPGSTEPLPDALQGLAGAIATATGGTCTITLDPTTGLLTMACGGTAFKVTWNAAMSRLLGGMPDLAVTATSVTSLYPPQHVVLLPSVTGNGWTQSTTVAASEAEDGTTYTIRSGVTRWDDDVTVQFIPRDPTFRTSGGDIASPWHPDDAYLTALGSTLTARVWSVSDMLAECAGKQLAFARGNLSGLCSGTATGDVYHLVQIPGTEIGAPRKTRQFPAWERFAQWGAKVLRLSGTPTSTRS